MPKIKVKNIPVRVMDRICGLSRYYVTDKKEYYRKLKIDSDNSIIELSEKDFPTNREWLASLSNDKLANNLVTNPIFIESGRTIEEWLSKPCESLMEEE